MLLGTVPPEQDVQVVAPEPETVPAVQDEHVVASATAEKVPAGQALHALDPALLE
jgi:hypothetical protein